MSATCYKSHAFKIKEKKNPASFRVGEDSKRWPGSEKTKKQTKNFFSFHPETKPETMPKTCFGSVLQDSYLGPIALANIWVPWETPQAVLIPPALQVLEEWFSRESLLEAAQLSVDFSALVLSKLGFLTGIIWSFKNQVIPLKQYVVSILSVTFRFPQVSAKCSCQAWQNFHSRLKLIRASALLWFYKRLQLGEIQLLLQS